MGDSFGDMDMTKYQVTWGQIPTGVKMRLGARDVAGSDNLTGCPSVLTFKVGSKPMYYVEIRLGADDTYTVCMYRLKRNTYEKVVLATSPGVYCDNLGSVLLGMEHHLA